MNKPMMLMLFPVLLWSQPVDIFLPTAFNLEILDESLKGNVALFQEMELIKDNSRLPEGIFTKLVNDKSGRLFASESIQRYYKRNSERIAKFSTSNMVTSIEDLDEKGKLDEKKIMKYNARNRLAEKIKYDDDNQIDEITKYEYNPDGRLLRESMYDKDGKLKDRNEIAYDTRGNITHELDYDSDSKLERRTLYLNYDANNNWLIKVTQSMDDDGTTRIMKRKIMYHNAVEIIDSGSQK